MVRERRFCGFLSPVTRVVRRKVSGCNSPRFLETRLRWIALFIVLLVLTRHEFAITFVRSAAVSELKSVGISEDDGSSSSAFPVVINEIHHSPQVKNLRSEFIELYNRSDEAVDLSGWLLDGGVRYLFPQEAIIPGEQAIVIAQDPSIALQLWGISAWGPYEGRLNGDGEEIVLRRPNAQEVDTVFYRLGFPWPTVGSPLNRSLNLLHPSLDNAVAGNWRSAAISPGSPNAVLTRTVPPSITEVGHSPRQPVSNQLVQVSASIHDPDGVAAVSLSYQVVEPGAYIGLEDPLYASKWENLPMTPQGAPDPSGQTYVVELPAALQVHRRLVRYRIHAADAQGTVITVPYADDPQPNFAYFVYDGVPPWQGAIRPNRSDRAPTHLGKVETYNFSAMRPLPVYHLISTEEDFDDALSSSGYEGSEYLWQGTLVYNGDVYDHIRYRARGGVWRYAQGKNMAKFDFNKGHYFQAHDDYGEPYAIKWDKLNLSAIIQHGERLHRGEQGLFESVGFRLFNLAGTEAPLTHYIHFRAITNAEETPSDQYNSDFRGLYLVVQQVDGQFLEEHGLPNGNLYKMEDGTGTLNNLGADAVSDRSDLNALIATYLADSPSEDWWRANVDVERFLNYRSIVEAIHHYDIKLKNYFYFHNPDSGLWQVHPWDIDQTWAKNMFGNGYEAFVRAGILRRPNIEREYENRLREIMDLLFNSEQTGLLIDEQAALVNEPADGLSMVDADRAMWDYNPLMESGRAVERKAGKGRFYESSPTGDFAGMGTLMKTWVVERTAWINRELIEKEDQIPDTPTLVYSGPPGFPADSLRFVPGIYRDPQGDPFAGIQWRIAPIHHPGVAAYDPTVRNRYEIEFSWQSEILADLGTEIQIPPGACLPGQTCRVRVRMLDAKGWWSHWSPPVEFAASAPVVPPNQAIVPTELMYNAINAGPIEGGDLEFLELKNLGGEPVDLSLMTFVEGIEYTFPRGSFLESGQHLVLADDPENFQRRYGFAPFGRYRGGLSNDGEAIRLSDPFGRTLFSLTYDDSAPWPTAADNQGYSAVLRGVNSNATALTDAASWRASTNIGGSPGADDPVPVRINEVLAHSGSAQPAFIELWNPTEDPAPLGGWYLTDSLHEPRQLRLPSSAVVPAEGFWMIDSAEWEGDDQAEGLELSAAGGTLYLLSANQQGRLTGYELAVHYGAAEEGKSSGRYVTSDNREHFIVQDHATPGGVNSSPQIGPLVFSKVAYGSVADNEFVEITNISAETVPLVDPAHRSLAWHLQGISYRFPGGLSIPPGGRILLVPVDPAQACHSASYRAIMQEAKVDLLNAAPGPLRILGPYAGTLSDNGGHLALRRPGWIDRSGAPVTIEAERINYRAGLPWPTLDNSDGALMLVRVSPGYSDEPSNWSAEPVVKASTASGPEVVLCSFDVFFDEEKGETRVQWVPHSESAVAGYYIWRSSGLSSQDAGVRLTAELITAGVSTESSSSDANSGSALIQYSFSLPRNRSDHSADALYWLEAVGTGGEQVTIAYTTPRRPPQRTFFPVIQ